MTAPAMNKRARRVVRGELQGVRRGSAAAEGIGCRHAAPGDVQEARAQLGGTACPAERGRARTAHPWRRHSERSEHASAGPDRLLPPRPARPLLGHRPDRGAHRASLVPVRHERPTRWGRALPVCRRRERRGPLAHAPCARGNEHEPSTVRPRRMPAHAPSSPREAQRGRRSDAARISRSQRW